MADRPSGVRRVPALLTALAAVVVLVGALGAVGVLEAPKAAIAATSNLSGAVAPVADGSAPEGAAASVGSSVALTGGNAAGGDAAASSGDGAATAGLGVELAAATTELVQALTQPVDDSAAPAAVDPNLVPTITATTPPVTDPAATQSATPDALPADSGSGRRVIYSISGQRIWLVEDDARVSRTYAVSGRLDRPDAGSYEIYAKSATATSLDETLQVHHVVRFAAGEDAAIAFHDIPALADGAPAQTEDQLGQPLSGGSVRQSAADAALLWDWAVLGTVVVVIA